MVGDNQICSILTIVKKENETFSMTSYNEGYKREAFA